VDALKLQQYLYAHIPLSAAMQVRVASVDVERVVLSAPLAPNINHRATVFGGSAVSLALLAGWSLLFVRLASVVPDSRLVIQRSHIEYLKPITAGFTATAHLANPQRWAAFVALLARRGRARLSVAASLACLGEEVGTFSGEYVALRSAGGEP
jgi:thioesterase domain-containing protein